jgi:hypothetical protein
MGLGVLPLAERRRSPAPSPKVGSKVRARAWDLLVGYCARASEWTLKSVRVSRWAKQPI